VRKATLDYEASARYDEQLHIGIRLLRLGNSSMTLQGCAFKGERPLVHGEIVYVFADPATQTSRPIPAVLRAWMEAFERGEPMVSIEAGDWLAMRAAATPLRHAVFVEEQGVPAEIEQDALDVQAHHIVARNRLGQALATGRLVSLDDHTGKIGRMAVVPSVRGAAVGREVLNALCEEAHRRRMREVLLHAQSPVIAFYQRAGFELASEPFEEAGIEHRLMRMQLPPR
jgi:predicted GNAT family N-acyltransferase